MLHESCDLRYLYDGTIWDDTCDRVIDEVPPSQVVNPWESDQRDPRPLSLIDDDGGRY